MSNNDEETVEQRLRDLRWDEDEETKVLEEDSLSDLRNFRAPGVELGDSGSAGRAHNPWAQRSDATLDFDSASWTGIDPVSDVVHPARRDNPTTLEVEVGEEQLAALRDERRARLKQLDAGARRAPTPRPAPPSQITPSVKKRTIREQAPSVTTGSHDLLTGEAAAYRHWNLKETSLAGILLSLVGVSEPAVLELHSGKSRAQLLISAGQLLEVRLLPCSAQHSLCTSLAKKGRVTPAQAASVRQYAMKHGVSEASALLKAGNLLPATTIRAAARARRRHLISRLLQAQLVEASAYHIESLPEGAHVAPIPLVGLLFERVRAYYDTAQPSVRAKAEQRYLGMHLKRKHNFAFSINHLEVSVNERQLLDRVLTRERPYDRVVHNSPTSRDATLSILAGLDAVGVLRVTTPGLSEHESSNSEEELVRASMRIDAMESRLKAENYFDILEVHWSSYDAEISRAYQELSAYFELIKQPLGLDAAQRARLGAIRGKLDRIYAVLRDPIRRAEYRRTLVPTANIRRAARKFDMLGAAAFRKRQFHSALDYYQRLLSLEPNNKSISRLLPVLLSRTTT